MKNVNFRIIFVLILVAISMVGWWRTQAAKLNLIHKKAVENFKATPELEDEKKAQLQKAFASLPLSFEKNQGQTDE